MFDVKRLINYKSAATRHPVLVSFQVPTYRPAEQLINATFYFYLQNAETGYCSDYSQVPLTFSMHKFLK